MSLKSRVEKLEQQLPPNEYAGLSCQQLMERIEARVDETFGGWEEMGRLAATVEQLPAGEAVTLPERAAQLVAMLVEATEREYGPLALDQSVWDEFRFLKRSPRS